MNSTFLHLNLVAWVRWGSISLTIVLNYITELRYKCFPLANGREGKWQLGAHTHTQHDQDLNSGFELGIWTRDLLVLGQGLYLAILYFMWCPVKNFFGRGSLRAQRRDCTICRIGAHALFCHELRHRRTGDCAICSIRAPALRRHQLPPDTTNIRD